MAWFSAQARVRMGQCSLLRLITHDHGGCQHVLKGSSSTYSRYMLRKSPAKRCMLRLTLYSNPSRNYILITFYCMVLTFEQSHMHVCVLIQISNALLTNLKPITYLRSYRIYRSFILHFFIGRSERSRRNPIRLTDASPETTVHRSPRR